jgi:DNA-binding transcriptional LysR family regulator
MEVRQLQIFRTLAEELSFTRTAEKVHTVQSNVTAQIKALEEELGIPLFDRLGRRVTLTTRDATSCHSPRRRSRPWITANAL